MKNLKLITSYLLAGFVVSVVEIGPSTILGVFPQAEARVGRPLTPVSVAGVARRTVRRCAAGVYYCQKSKVIPTKATSSHALVKRTVQPKG
ncbi:MAG: hypothetical protein ACXVA9_07220 [Bdellovibrionales bacterium]